MIQTVKFTLRPDIERIRIDFTSVFAAGVQWFFAVEGPYGTIKALDLGTVDFTGENGQFDIEPTGPLGEGDYVLTAIAWDLFEINGQRAAQIRRDVAFCYEPEREFEISLEGGCSTVKAKDINLYPTIASITRAMSIEYPTVPKLPTPDDATSSQPMFEISAAQPDGNVWENVTWRASGSSSGVFRTVVGEVTIEYPLTYNQGVTDLFVKCALDLCGAVDCVASFWAGLNAKACGVGGISKLKQGEQDRAFAALAALSVHAHYAQCDDTANAIKWLGEVEKALGKTCPDGPKAVRNALPWQDEWNVLGDADLGAGFTVDAVNPLSVRIVNGVAYFRGNFRGTIWSVNGGELIPPAFFQALGQPVLLGSGAIMGRAVPPSVEVPAGAAYVNQGGIWVRSSGSGFDPSSLARYTIYGSISLV